MRRLIASTLHWNPAMWFGLTGFSCVGLFVVDHKSSVAEAMVFFAACLVFAFLGASAVYCTLHTEEPE
ncbi:MAG: hypothetical protein AAF125_05660 [Chloroflexota bacterium]